MVIIVRTDVGQPRPKYIFNKCESNIHFFLLSRGLVHPHDKISCSTYPKYLFPTPVKQTNSKTCVKHLKKNLTLVNKEMTL